jgi:hypothetical protein
LDWWKHVLRDWPLIIYYRLTKTSLETFRILDNGRFKSTI